MENNIHTLGFSFRTSANSVQISRNGTPVTTLRGHAARRFAVQVADMDNKQQQQLMARVTGNYKRGNEKQARNKHRNKYC